MRRVAALLIGLALTTGIAGCPAGPVEVELDISSTSGGMVTEPGEGTITYEAGTVVDLVATPEDGYRFRQWTGDTRDIHLSILPSTTITMNDHYSITASFEQITHDLTISTSQGGSVTVTVDEEQILVGPGETKSISTIPVGIEVHLEATPEQGYAFVQWEGEPMDGVTDAVTITMNDHYSMTASFAQEVWDWYCLDAIRDNLSGSYALMNNLDSATPGYDKLAGPTANHESGWSPIAAFSGRFYGRGYEIRELFICLPANSGVGLFGHVSGGGAIASLGVVNIEVTGHDAVGGLVGVNHGTVTNCHSAGSVAGSDNVGSLVGWNQGTVSASFSIGGVTGRGSVGGLAGANYRGTLDSCHSESGVSGESHVGGLVGWNQESTVSNSYAIGSVTGGSSVGGLIGWKRSATVTNSYYSYDEVTINGKNMITCGALFGEDFEEWLANGRFLDVNQRLSRQDGYYLIDGVSDFKQLLAFGQDGSLRFRLETDLDLATEPDFYIPYLAGVFDGNGNRIRNLTVDLGSVSDVGLFGYLSPSGTLREVAAENVSILANDSVGGLVGWNQGMVTHSFASGSVTGRKGVAGLAGHGSGGTLRYSYFTGSVAGDWSVAGLVGDGPGVVQDSHYSIDEVLINGRNVITIGALFCQDFDQWLANGMFLDVSERLSRDTGYYVINDVSDFKQLLAFGQDRTLKFRLEGDLDLEGEPEFYIPYLAGEFDGDGHRISNLSLPFCHASSRLGVFGFLARSGKVTNLGVQKVDVSGGGGVGGLVGYSWGAISNSYSTGSVIGAGDVGGLVGMNGYNAAVSKSYSIASVAGGSSVGGLVGRNWLGTVRESYSAGSVAGDRDVGGLVGWNNGAIRNSYSSGSVVGVDYVGGLVGRDDDDLWGSGWSSQSFWDVEASNMDTSDGGTGNTTAEMMDAATFGRWDIVAVAPGETDPTRTWNIVDGQTYPFLSWQSVP